MIAEKISMGIIMDPIHLIFPKKDTTLALMLKAQDLGWQLHYLELKNLFLQDGRAFGETRPITVFDNVSHWFELGTYNTTPLDQFDVLLMRKDPPIDLEYIYATHILEHVEPNGTLVVNNPQALRDVNEKAYATWFPQCMPPTIISASLKILKDFIEEHTNVILKPLSGMGGRSIFKTHMGDPNLSVILETLTQFGTCYTMAQQFIPDIITSGDKRIFLIDGEPLPVALARIPQKGEFRGNLAAGGQGHGVKLNERDLWICSQVGRVLKNKGLLFVGLDVIGDYLTEINVTSPTCVRELEQAFDIDITGKILNSILRRIQN